MTGTDLLLVLAAVVAGSLLKSVTGVGLPLVAVPIMALVVGMEDAVAVVAVPNVLVNSALAWRERDAVVATRDLGRLCATAVIGAVVGTVLLVSIPAEPLVVLLAIAVLGYAAVALASPDFAISAQVSHRWAPAVGASAGFLQGAVGISGPLATTWLHGYRLQQRAYILSISLLFLAAGAMQSVLLFADDRLAGLWVPALSASVIAVATVPLGAHLRGRLRSQTFDRVVLGMLVVSTLALVAQTFRPN